MDFCGERHMTTIGTFPRPTLLCSAFPPITRTRRQKGGEQGEHTTADAMTPTHSHTFTILFDDGVCRNLGNPRHSNIPVTALSPGPFTLLSFFGNQMQIESSRPSKVE